MSTHTSEKCTVCEGFGFIDHGNGNSHTCMQCDGTGRTLTPGTKTMPTSNERFASVLPTADELKMLREAYAETYPVRPLLNEIDRLQKSVDTLNAANRFLSEQLESERVAHETCEWREKAAAWLRGKAAEQEKANREYPDHAAAYQSWRDRPGLFRMLADSVLREPNAQKASDECCCAERGGGLVCTLPKGHAGQHEAWGARKNLLQSWPAMKADPPRGAKARDFVEYDPYGGVRVDMARYLRSPAGQAQLALGGKKASERQPCSHGNATGHCQHCLDAL